MPAEFVELPSSKVAKETTDKLIAGNALMQCFQDLQSTEISPEQRILEMKLEKLAQQFVEIETGRMQTLSEHGTTTTLPIRVKVPDIKAMRSERKEMLDSIDCAQEIPNMMLAADSFANSMKKYGSMRGEDFDIACWLVKWLQEFDHRCVRIRHHVMRKLAHMHADEATVERLRAEAQPLLDRSAIEYEMAQRLIQQLEDWIEGARSKGYPLQSQEDSALPSLPPLPITKADVAFVLGHLSSKHAAEVLMGCFLARNSCIPVASPQDLSNKLADQESKLQTIYSSLNQIAGKGTPVMVTAPEKLTAVLEGLRKQFSIAANVMDEDGQPFLFQSHRLALMVHAIQSADRAFPAYGSNSSPEVRHVTVPTSLLSDPHFGSLSGPEPAGGKSGVSMAARDLVTTFVKGCPWGETAERLLRPNSCGMQDAQHAELHSNELVVDHVLKVEAAFLCEDDAKVAGRRIDELVRTHEQRATPSTEPGVGPIGQGGVLTLTSLSGKGDITAEALPSKPTVLQADSLLPLYWLRLIRTRQARKKVLSNLNYLQSVQRKIVHELTGFSFVVSGEEVYAYNDAAPSEGHKKKALRQEKLNRQVVVDRKRLEKGEHPGIDDQQIRPDDLPQDPKVLFNAKAVVPMDDFVSVDDDGTVRITDSAGVRIVYSRALDDMARVDDFLVRMGSYFFKNFKERYVPDRSAVLLDLYESYLAFVEAKHKLVANLMCAFDNCTSKSQMQSISQRIADVLKREPLVDLSAQYFAPSFASSVMQNQLEATLASDMVTALCMMDDDIGLSCLPSSQSILGIPIVGTAKSLSPTPIGDTGVTAGPFDVLESCGLIGCAFDCIDDIYARFVQRHIGFFSSSQSVLLRRCIVEMMIVDWRMLIEERIACRAVMMEVHSPKHAGANNAFGSTISGPISTGTSHVLENPTILVELTLRAIDNFDKPGDSLKSLTESELHMMLAARDQLSHDQSNVFSRTVMLLRLHTSLASSVCRQGVLEPRIKDQLKQCQQTSPQYTAASVAGEGAPKSSAGQVNGLCPFEPTSSLKLTALVDQACASFNLADVASVASILTDQQTFRWWCAADGLEAGIAAVMSASCFNNTLLQQDVLSKVNKKRSVLESSLPPGATLTISQADSVSDGNDLRSAAFAELVSFEKEQWVAIAGKLSKPALIVNASLSAFSAHVGAQAVQGGPNGVRAAKLKSCPFLLDQLALQSRLLMLQIESSVVARSLGQRVSGWSRGGQPFGGLSSSRGGGDDTSSYSRGASLPNNLLPTSTTLDSIWTIPFSNACWEDLPQEPEKLALYCKFVKAATLAVESSLSMHRLTVTSEQVAVDPNSGNEMAQAELIRLRSSIDGIQSSHKPEVYVDLMQRKARIFWLRLWVSLRAGERRCLAENDATAAQFVLRARIASSTGHSELQLPGTLQSLGVANDPRTGTPLAFPRVVSGDPLVAVSNDKRMSLHVDAQQTMHLLESETSGKSLDFVSELKAQEAAIESACALERLQDQLIKVKGMQAPISHRQFIAVADMLDSHVTVQLLKAREIIDEEKAAWESKVYAGEVQGQGGGADAEAASALSYDLTTEANVRRFLRAAAREAVSLAWLQERLNQIRGIHAKVIEEIDNAAIGGPGIDTDASSSRVNNIRKVDILVSFLADIRRVSKQKMASDGTISLQIPRHELTKFVDSLARSLRNWGEFEIQNKTMNLQSTISSLQHRLKLAERDANDAATAHDLEQRSLARRLETSVTDRCYGLLFQADALTRKIAEGRREAATLEATVREKVKEEYEGLVKDLAMQLTFLQSQFREYRDSLQTDMRSNLHDIRKDALTKMVTASSAPADLKKRAQKMAESEEVVRDLSAENVQLKRALQKLRTMHQLKDASLRASFVKQIEKAEGAKKHASKELHHSKDDVDRKMALLQKQIGDTQAALGEAEAERDKLKKELELARRNKQTLLQWKLSKTVVLEELDSKVKKYERWAQVDVDRLMSELEKREAELRAHELGDGGMAQRVRGVEERNERELKRLRVQLQREQKLKAQAVEKLEHLRRELNLEAPSALSSPAGGEEFWKRRVVDAQKRVEDVAEENRRLWSLVREHGVQVPREVLSTISTPSPAARPMTHAGGARTSLSFSSPTRSPGGPNQRPLTAAGAGARAARTRISTQW